MLDKTSSPVKSSNLDALTPNFEQAKRFLKMLDPKAQAFTFQVIEDKKPKDRKADSITLHGSFDLLKTELAEDNAKGYGVFVTVSETNLVGRKATDITRVRAVWREIDKDKDNAEAAARLRHGLPRREFARDVRAGL